jgi:hypothetical protein
VPGRPSPGPGLSSRLTTAGRCGRSERWRPELTVLRSIAHRALSPRGLGGIHPLLFAAYPVLFLWSQNTAEIAPGEVAEPLVIVVGGAALATLVLGVVFGDRRRAALIVAPGVLGALLWGHIAGLADVPEEVRLAGWLGVIGLGAFGAFRLGGRRLGSIDTGLLRLGLIVLAVPLVMIVPYEVEEALRPAAPVLADRGTLESATSARKRDVYWIVLDRYGSDRSLELRFGATNELTPWLRERGFSVLEDSHANYVSTAMSMATTLNMAHLERLTGLVGSHSSTYAPIYSRLQTSRVVRQFKALGYRYLHLGSWWNPTRTDVAADVNYNADLVSEVTTLVVQLSVAPRIYEALGLEDESAATESAKHVKHNSYALDTLDRLRDEPGPKLVVAHVLLPHPPYVFDRDGRYIGPDEAATLDETDAWQRQFEYTNGRLRAFVEGLLALPEDEQPIIILQSDEGPWTEAYASDRDGYDWAIATPAELEIKFGILNAWYLPGDTDLALDPSMTAINTFPVLFSRYFGLDYELLDDRITATRGWRRPYQLIDITERLARPE